MKRMAWRLVFPLVNTVLAAYNVTRFAQVVDDLPATVTRADALSLALSAVFAAVSLSIALAVWIFYFARNRT